MNIVGNPLMRPLRELIAARAAARSALALRGVAGSRSGVIARSGARRHHLRESRPVKSKHTAAGLLTLSPLAAVLAMRPVVRFRSSRPSRRAGTASSQAFASSSAHAHVAQCDQARSVRSAARRLHLHRASIRALDPAHRPGGPRFTSARRRLSEPSSRRCCSPQASRHQPDGDASSWLRRSAAGPIVFGLSKWLPLSLADSTMPHRASST